MCHYEGSAARRLAKGDPDMKRTAIAALGAAMIATLATSSPTHAALISFSFGAFDGSITHDGASLDVSTVLDLNNAVYLVMEVDPGDSSGLADFDSISLSAETSPPSGQIIYGSTPGPLGADVILSWPMVLEPGTDAFTETLTTVDAIDRGTPDEITVTLSGTLSDTDGHFANSPVSVVLHATEDLGATFPTVTFTNTSGAVSTPEASTWLMMALGFGALGYAGFRKRLNLARMAGNGAPSI
jgi:hypothetical protein